MSRSGFFVGIASRPPTELTRTLVWARQTRWAQMPTLCPLCARAVPSPQRFYSLSAQIQRERKDHLRGAGADAEGDARCNGTAGLVPAHAARCRRRRPADAGPCIGEGSFLATLGRHADERATGEDAQSAAGWIRWQADQQQVGRRRQVSPDTALRDIMELVKLGVLKKTDAGGRSTAYELE